MKQYYIKRACLVLAVIQLIMIIGLSLISINQINEKPSKQDLENCKRQLEKEPNVYETTGIVA